jgi:hypothetical protein
MSSRFLGRHRWKRGRRSNGKARIERSIPAGKKPANDSKVIVVRRRGLVRLPFFSLLAYFPREFRAPYPPIHRPLELVED